MTLTPDDLNEFRKLIEDNDHHRERECQEYLRHAAGLLLPSTPIDFDDVQEDRNYFGRTDFILSANTLRDDNTQARVAYIWELKAPQCFLFEKDTATRCRATKEFLGAENQLLHYAHLALGDNHFRTRMNVVDGTNIHIGGIIIGTKDRFLKGSTGSRDRQNAETALKVRQLYLYKSHGIRVMTWDRIFDYVRASTMAR